ncbi:hypothetical protein I4U23_015528 [Adineta vaga]|nr:hypothetical protein I4U23_015528 [Adineta vaga]
MSIKRYYTEEQYQRQLTENDLDHVPHKRLLVNDSSVFSLYNDLSRSTTILLHLVFVQTITQRQVTFYSARLGLQIRNLLVVMIYKHVLRLKATFLLETNTERSTIYTSTSTDFVFIICISYLLFIPLFLILVSVFVCFFCYYHRSSCQFQQLENTTLSSVYSLFQISPNLLICSTIKFQNYSLRYRSHLTVIPQQSVLLSGTRRYNLNPFHHTTLMNNVEKHLKMCN